MWIAYKGIVPGLPNHSIVEKNMNSSVTVDYWLG